ncbi:YidB family protein [Cupriavidus sp. Marseille-Q8015]
MGLLDSMLGGVLGQLGGQQQDGQAAAGGLNPKLMMALGLLAMLAMRNKGGHGAPATGADDAGAPDSAGGLGGLGGLGGVLGGMLGGGSAPAPGGLDLGSLLGGLLGGQGEAAGSAQAMGAAAGGIGALREVLAQAGLGQQVDSWIGTGANEPVSPAQLSTALGGSGALDSLAETTGMTHEDVAASLSEGLPELIDRLTPQGRVPGAE